MGFDPLHAFSWLLTLTQEVYTLHEPPCCLYGQTPFYEEKSLNFK